MNETEKTFLIMLVIALFVFIPLVLWADHSIKARETAKMQACIDRGGQPVIIQSRGRDILCMAPGAIR